MTESESALIKPIRNVFRLFGAIFDAVYYFVDSLFNPGRAPNSRLNSRNYGRSSGPRIGTLRPHGSGGNAPNMSIGGCKSCI